MPFSTKLADASKGTRAAGEFAASKTFAQAPTLPLPTEPRVDAGAARGRTRLGGAWLIDISRIRPDPTQPRRILQDASQRELVASIRQLGILQPIAVRYLEQDDIYQVISGERRYQASLSAGLKEIPCWVQEPEEKQILIRQVVENWQRADLHPFDLADALAQMRDALGFSQKEIAELTGKPESEISRLLSLLKLHPVVQRKARQDPSGMVTRRHLVAVVQMPREEQPQILQQIEEKRLTAQATEKLVKEAKALRTGAKRQGAPLTQMFRYITSDAVVTVRFRRRDADTIAAARALQEAQAQIKAERAQEAASE